MGTIDQISIARDLQKPMLFLWGEADVQVSREHFDACEEGLGVSSLFTYKTYPGLNHLFIPAQSGESIENIMSYYSIPSSVDVCVSQDIAT